MPDIDVDFCMNRRGEVIEYVTREIRTRAGSADHHVRHHGGQGGDQGFRPRDGHSVSREVDRIVKMVPPTLNITHRAGAEGFARAGGGLRERAADQGADRYGEEARRPGAQLGRACGRRGDLAATADRSGSAAPDEERRNRDAYDMKAVEKMGLLKMDFLGLTTLTIIDDA